MLVSVCECARACVCSLMCVPFLTSKHIECLSLCVRQETDRIMMMEC